MHRVSLSNVGWVYLDVFDVWYDASHHTWLIIGPKMTPKWPKTLVRVFFAAKISCQKAL